MEAIVTFPTDLRKSLEQTSWAGTGVCGFLIGRLVKEDIYVLNIWKLPDAPDRQLFEDLKKCTMHLPGGTDIVGVIIVTPSCNQENIHHELKSLPTEVQNVLPGSPFVICCMHLTPEKRNIIFCVLDKNGKLLTVSENIDPEKCRQELMVFRIKAQIMLSMQHDENKSSIEDAWIRKTNKTFANLDLSVMSGEFSYGIRQTSIILKENSFIGPSTLKSCGDLYSYIDEQSGLTNSHRKRDVAYEPPVIVEMYRQISGNSDRFTQPTVAPAVHHKTGNFQSINMNLPIDVLVEQYSYEHLDNLAKIFNEALRRQLTAMKYCLLTYRKNRSFYLPEPFHFRIPARQTSVTVIYPRAPEHVFEQAKPSLHQFLCLPMDMPLFRKACAMVFVGQTAAGGYLINPHIGLPPSGVKSGKVHIVYGNYSYHHYMQDRFDDDKWGCAYRSLQTLVSWFRFQGYTNHPIPSHGEIQRALVTIGDKQHDFIGSKRWIGSFEVSFCLDHMLGVKSKFLSLSSGAELASNGRELADHFDTQGTPIMIGGGVLAHTLLGVHYDEKSGDIRFLVLDPHYTGGEDLQRIQNEGWCGWKSPDFWEKKAHYNLCMPQRPNLT